MKEDRKEILLKAVYDLLKKCNDSHYVLNAIEQTIFYDGTECDGGCLMNDIAEELGLDNEKSRKTIDWTKTTKEEYALISKIIERTKNMDSSIFESDLGMDLAAVNSICSLDFEKLLDFHKSDFMHDIYGIRKNINRETGELQNCFLPRCAK
jgi:hypothetical protein